MEVHFFILSTMSYDMTKANLPEFPFEKGPVIQKFIFPRQGVIKMTIWIACQDAIINELLPEILPYMDAAICWYHDHSPLSCLKVRNAVSTLEQCIDTIWLMNTTIPKLRMKHQSKIKKMYNKIGFQRPMLSDTLANNFEQILHSLQHSLQIQKYLNK